MYTLDAWHVITTTDPLHDSDDEADEHVRADYRQSSSRFIYIYSGLTRRAQSNVSTYYLASVDANLPPSLSKTPSVIPVAM